MDPITTPTCPVCGTGLKVTASTSKAGKPFLSLACTRDPRDFRAFINNRDYIQQVLDSLEGQTRPDRAVSGPVELPQTKMEGPSR